MLKIISLTMTLLLLGAPVYRWLRPGNATTGELIARTVIFGAILLIGASFLVRGYSITDRDVVIHHLFFSRRLPLATLTRATIDPAAMAFSLRTFGIGGLGGYIGWFRNERLGAYQAYVTNAANMVVLVFGSKAVVISPVRPADFLADLAARAPQLGRD
jgi:hypothetical protein